jgi:hypothetical protein
MTTTANLGLTNLPSNSLQPDVPINTDLAILDAAIAGALTFNFTVNANLTLTATQSQNATLILTDTGVVLTLGRDVVFPARFPTCYVKNATAQTLTLKKTGQTGVALLAGTDGMFIAGATDVLRGSVTTQGAASPSSAVTALSIAAGVVNIDCSLGNYFTLPLTANVTSVTFTNLPAAGRGQSIAIRAQQDITGARTVALPASFKAITGSDTAVQSAVSAWTILHIETFDQGTRWEYSMKAGSA